MYWSSLFARRGRVDSLPTLPYMTHNYDLQRSIMVLRNCTMWIGIFIDMCDSISCNTSN